MGAKHEAGSGILRELQRRTEGLQQGKRCSILGRWRQSPEPE